MLFVRPCIRLFPSCQLAEMSKLFVVPQMSVAAYILKVVNGWGSEWVLAHRWEIGDQPKAFALMEQIGVGPGTLLIWRKKDEPAMSAETIRYAPEPLAESFGHVRLFS